MSLFRPSKRRKFHRPQRAIDDEDEGSPALNPPSPRINGLATTETLQGTASGSELEVEGTLTVADLIRQRKIHQRKRAGVEFNSTLETNALPPPPTELALVPQDESSDLIKAMENRFMQQTGRVTEEANIHMYEPSLSLCPGPYPISPAAATNRPREAYIDRELQRRALSSSRNHQQELQASPSAANANPLSTLPANGTTSGDPSARNPTSLGKLHEIDLGPSARLQNEARTEAAMTGVPVEPPKPKKQPKPRRGRNGKMYIPRPRADRNRRNSVDVARDKLVEDLLRESKLDVYEAQEEAARRVLGPGQKDGGAEAAVEDGGAADDRLAEQFQKDYFDAQTQRRERASKSSAAGGAGSKKTGEEKSRGPKLGGSRNARAAMREREEAAARTAAASKARR